MELEIDKKGLVHVRIDRKRKLPVTTLLFALGYTRDDVANLFRHPEDPDRVNPFIQMTLDKDATEGDPPSGDRKSLKDWGDTRAVCRWSHRASKRASTAPAGVQLAGNRAARCTSARAAAGAFRLAHRPARARSGSAPPGRRR